MTTNRRISVSSLDFDTIKANLKNFLKDQEQFSDFDFEGSNMSVLLDVLAYNTHYNALYTNMALNEVFLDSANRRSSVVSIARGLGYTPRSASSATTTINFSIVNTISNNQFLLLPAFSPFSGNINGERFTFYTTENHTAVRQSNGSYNYSNIKVVEGVPLRNRLAYTADNRYLIPNSNVDLSTLTVKIQANASSTSYDVYTPVTFEANIDGDSKIYFIKEIDNGIYEISFGDGILGKALSTGNVVNLSYFATNGKKANNIRNLTYGGTNIDSGTINNVILNAPTLGGKDAESIDEIRFNAPNLYAAQNRAVTANDYEAIILNKVPEINSVIVWGGENNVPPAYGKVFISATTKTGSALTFEQQQTIITDVIDKYKVISVLPVFTDPEYINVELDVVIYFDETITRNTGADIKTAVINQMKAINFDLNKFNKILRTSSISRAIDAADPAILSSAIRMKMYKPVIVYFAAKTKYTIDMGNPIDERSMISTAFKKDGSEDLCYMYDSGGTVYHYSVNEGTRTELGAIGTINYSTGLISINDIKITGINTAEFLIIARPGAPDIVSRKNQIVVIDESKLKVSVISDQSTKGRTLSGNKFVFSSNKI